MRLNLKEIAIIQKAFRTIFQKNSFKLYLFGSRTDNNKKGGDIDLLVLVDQNDKQIFIDGKIKILKAIFEDLDEQKIDITVVTHTELNSDFFLKIISKSMIEL